MAFDFNTFGCMVFGDEEMKARLPKEVYDSLKKSIEENQSIDPKIADVVADAMMHWAIEHGATHYTHWFQPMTNITAGKHDSFLSLGKDGKMTLHFPAKSSLKVSRMLRVFQTADCATHLRRAAIRRGTAPLRHLYGTERSIFQLRSAHIPVKRSTPKRRFCDRCP